MKTDRAFLFNTCEVAPFFQNIFRSAVFPGSWEFFSSGEKDFVHGKGRYFFRLPPGWLQIPGRTCGAAGAPQGERAYEVTGQ
jgi:hypothetical protein